MGQRIGSTPFASITSLATSGKEKVGNIDLRLNRTFSVSAKVDYNASATSGIKVNFYYSPDGENFDTVPYTFFTVDLTAGSTIQETHIIDTPEHGMMEIEVENVDATYTATNIQVWVTAIKHADGGP